jgi:alkylation response protein AidB-like acyl-CoA dehydrogenase
MNLPAVLQSLIWTEVGRTFVQFKFGGEADNILYYANDGPEARSSCCPRSRATGSPASRSPSRAPGSDAANIKLRAVRDGDDWVLNGEKTFITNGNDADFAIVVAVTDPSEGAAAAAPRRSWSTARWAGGPSSSRPWARAARPR